MNNNIGYAFPQATGAQGHCFMEDLTIPRADKPSHGSTVIRRPASYEGTSDPLAPMTAHLSGEQMVSIGARLTRSGVALVGRYDPGSMEDHLLCIATALGRPVASRRGNAVVSQLDTPDRESARRCSLSQLSGDGSQPWHVDGAHRPVPYRYLVLGCTDCESPFVATTELLHFSVVSALKAPAAHRSPFTVRNGRESFYATVTDPARSWVRFDPGCMTPQSPEAEMLAASLALADTKASHSHQWSIGDILVIDNWAVFHRRFVPAGAGRRTLLRIPVMEH